jgi:hypothetical protein
MNATVLRRTLVLTLLIISMLGPWTFDLINVPAQYECDTPFVRLYGDFCGYPLSGFGTVKWATSGFFYILGTLIQGNFKARLSELMILLCALIVVLPFFSVVIVLMYRNSRRLRASNVIVWGLACLPTLTLFILQATRAQSVQFFHLLWGLWLYILLAIGTVIVEILVWRSNSKISTKI